MTAPSPVPAPSPAPLPVCSAAPAREEPLENVAYVYDGTLEGLLTAVFRAYENHEDPQDVVKAGTLRPRLDQSMRTIETDQARALRVAAGVRRTCGDEAFQKIMHASLSDDPTAGTVVYRFICYAMPPGCTSADGRRAKARPRALDEMTHPAVEPLLRLDRAVMNERHKLMQFMRFEHLDNGVWFARCNPNASVVPLLMDWFSARFNTQPFIVFDENHALAGVSAGGEWYLVSADAIDLPAQASEERLMQSAWKLFYDTVAVEARYNPELRRQFMPMRLWKNILEVQDELPGTDLRK